MALSIWQSCRKGCLDVGRQEEFSHLGSGDQALTPRILQVGQWNRMASALPILELWMKKGRKSV